jgi:predicted dehydrogenase
MGKLKIGFIGFGGIAQTHVEGWKKLPSTEIVAVADVSPQARKYAVEGLGLPETAVFEDHTKMLKQVELDAVDICTPNSYHFKPTVDAFKAGCHVIVEKPCGTSAKQVEQMTAAGHEAGKLFMVAQSLRYVDSSLILKNWVDAGLIGEAYWARASMLRVRGVPAWGAFIDKGLSEGGPCYDIGVHILDLCLWLMGHPQPVSVSAGTYLKIADKPSLMGHDPAKYTVPEDFAVGFVRFANGASISLEASWALNLPGGVGNAHICGTKGGLQWAPPTLVTEANGMVANTTPQVNPFERIHAHQEEIRLFVEAIEKGLPSPVPGEQALITQKILDGMYKSGQQGKEVKV